MTKRAKEKGGEEHFFNQMALSLSQQLSYMKILGYVVFIYIETNCRMLHL